MQREKEGRSLPQEAGKIPCGNGSDCESGRNVLRAVHGEDEDVMTETERKAIRKGLSLMREACTENTDGCKSCEYFNKQTGCMFKTKPYPSRWRLERG